MLVGIRLQERRLARGKWIGGVNGADRWPLRVSWGGFPGPMLVGLAPTQAGMGRAGGAGAGVGQWLVLIRPLTSGM